MPMSLEPGIPASNSVGYILTGAAWQTPFSINAALQIQFFKAATYLDVIFPAPISTGAVGKAAGGLVPIFHQTVFQENSFSYAAFFSAKLTGVQFLTCDLSGADMVECTLKDFAFEETRLTGASFFKTSLAGIDLTGCPLEGIRVSEHYTELRGAIVDLFQAAELAKLLGITIKP